MTTPTLLAVGAVHLATAAAFIAVGARLRQRAVAPEHRLAQAAFVSWWWGFATYLAGQGLLDLAAGLGDRTAWPHVAFRYVAGPLLGGAAAGLAFHTLYLWTGRRGWAVPLAFYYGAAGALYSAVVWAHHPTGIVVTPWSADLAYEEGIAGPLWNAVLASIGLPLVLGSAGYLGLVRRATSRERRYRIALVGASLILWVVSGYAGQVSGGSLVRFATIVPLGLATAGAVLAAYFPPRAVRRWLARAAPPMPPSQ